MKAKGAIKSRLNVLEVWLNNQSLMFLPTQATLVLYQVSKSVQKMLWKEGKQVWTHVLCSGQKQFRYWFKKVYYPVAAPHINLDAKDQIEYQLQVTKNMFRNPNGKNKFEYWKVLKNGGDGWAIESVWPHLRLKQFFKKLQYAFVGSYAHCEMAQVLDLACFQNVFRSFNFLCTLQAGVYVALRLDSP